jgi:hypothetical protein
MLKLFENNPFILYEYNLIKSMFNNSTDDTINFNFGLFFFNFKKMNENWAKTYRYNQ